MVQLARECSDSARRFMVSKGITYVPSPRRYILAGGEVSTPNGMKFVLRCMSDPIVYAGWHIMLLANRVEEAIRRKDAPG